MTPLAETLRPKNFKDVVGQEQLVGPGSFLFTLTQNQRPLSFILWGPPGCGKTTIARLFLDQFNIPKFSISADSVGIQKLKLIIQNNLSKPLLAQSSLVFVDEIHRLNKSQQDIFLPHIESGALILVGTTTENPSFAINNALLSRVRVLTLSALSKEELMKIVSRFCKLHPNFRMDLEVKKTITDLAQGDARILCNLLENLTNSDNPVINRETLEHLLQKRLPKYDKTEDHYNLISALHKSIRGSDHNAALYWLHRMLNSGENPEYILRRLTRIATEDIGLADPNALQIALNAWECFKRLGNPEGLLAITQATIYLALAPKSCSTYNAEKKAREHAAKTSSLPPPMHILNAPTKLMKNLGYGKDYKYDHFEEDAFSGQNYFPTEICENYFFPVKRGFERELTKRIEYFESLRKKRTSALMSKPKTKK